MLDAIGGRMAEASGKALSWRQMAEAAGVGLATLKHYFGTREDIVRALFHHWRESGEEPLSILAKPTTGSFEKSITDAAFHLQAGLDHGVDHMISVGLAECLTNQIHASDFLKASLEPIVAAMTARLEDHQNSGEMLRTVNARFAALSFVSPILLAHLHQKRLGGEVSHPLDRSDFLKQHARAFAESYGT